MNKKVDILLTSTEDKQYVYVDQKDAAEFFILQKMLEMFTSYPSTVVGINDQGGRVEGWLFNSCFDINKLTYLVRSDLFSDVLELLNKEKIIESKLDMHILENELLEHLYERKDLTFKEVYSFAVKSGQHFPTAPINDIAYSESIYNFRICSIDRLRKKLNDKKGTLSNLDTQEKFYIEYNPNQRIIKINGLTLSRPNFGSQNDIAFEYIYQNPRKKIKRQEINEADKEFNKSLVSVLNDLGFSSKLKKIFFPNTSKDALYFRNPVTQSELFDEGLFFDKNDLKKEISSIVSARKSKNGVGSK